MKQRRVVPAGRRLVGLRADGPFLAPPAARVAASSTTQTVGVGVLLVAWVLAGLLPTLHALDYLHDPDPYRAAMGTRAVVSDLAWAVAAVVVTMSGVVIVGRWGTPDNPRVGLRRLLTRTSPWWDNLCREALCAVVSFWLLLGSLSLVPAVNAAAGADRWNDYPTPSDPGAVDVWGAFLSAALAGPKEELFYCLLLALVCRRGLGWSWPAVIALSALLRVAFHVYYGPGAVVLLVWAAGTVALFAWTGRLVGIVVAHSLLNVVATANQFTPQWSWIPEFLILAMFPLAMVGWGLRNQPHVTAAGGAPAAPVMSGRIGDDHPAS